MATPQPFSYQDFFAKNAPVTARATPRRAKYDFATAYPDPDTLPLDGLADALKQSLDRDGRDLAYYPNPAGHPPLRAFVADKLARAPARTLARFLTLPSGDRNMSSRAVAGAVSRPS